ncbi:acetyl xylan esterase II [Coprinopsis sp. MPI-PUGE-AT-0042]|nr:acetyl xylan esterase II [Coprinopsis sp. MPI-PUGE-AT-0042]
MNSCSIKLALAALWLITPHIAIAVPFNRALEARERTKTTITLPALPSLPTPVPVNDPATPQPVPELKIFKQCLRPNTVALTFPPYLPWWYRSMRTVDVLNANGANGTFFINGDNYGCVYDEAKVAALQRMYNSGHQIGSGTWSHIDLSEQSLSKAEGKKILGAIPNTIRFAYGRASKAAQDEIAESGKVIVLWDFDSGDTAGVSASDQIQRYQDIAASRPSSLLSLQQPSEEILQEVLPITIRVLKNAGYDLVTVEQCMSKQVPAYHFPATNAFPLQRGVSLSWIT